MEDKKEAVPKTEAATPVPKVVSNTSTNGGAGGNQGTQSQGNVGANTGGTAGSGTDGGNRGGSGGGGSGGGGGPGGFRRGGGGGSGGGGGGGRFFGNQRGGGGGGDGNRNHSQGGGGRGSMRGNNFDDNRRGGGGGGGGRFQGRDGSGGQRGGDRQQNHNNQRDDDHMGGGGGGGRNLDRQLHDKLMEMSGPTYELPPLDIAEKKFSGRSRLYIGNIPPDVNEDELTEKFKKYGEVSEVFLNKEKNFGFIRLDYHCNAERAKNELNGTVIKNRTLKIRFAPNGSMLKVKNLDEHVTNELLHLGFSAFGEIDRAVVVLDDRGKPTGEGLVEFSRKNQALFAVRKCTEGCFFLTKNIRPVLVELYEATDESDGYSDRFANKKHPDYMKNRSMGPRVAPKDSFEHDYGMRWKQLYELHKQKMQALNKELEIDQNKLIAQMEYARYEHETAMLREQLRAREMDMDRQKREWEMKQQQAEEDRRRSDEHMRRQEEEIQTRMLHQEEEMRRRQQENNLFLQAQQLNNMLEHQEQVYGSSGGGGGAGGGGGGGGAAGGGGGTGDMDNNLFSEVNMDSAMDQKPGGFGGKGGYADRMGNSGGGSGGGGNADRMGGSMGNKQRGGGYGGDRNDRTDRSDGGSLRGMGGSHGTAGQRGGSAGVTARGGGNNTDNSGGNFWAANNDNYGHNKRRRF